MLISVVMPAYNDRWSIDRAVKSLLRQTHPDWELVAVDDGSTDGCYERLVEWGREDGRVRTYRTEENRGPAAARNQGIRAAAGWVLAYLDSDDEYYPDFLWNVDHFASKGDVQVFGYDVVEDDRPEKPVRTWDPGQFKSILFGGNLAAPLGIAHRRDLAIQLGGFNEELWALEDWDLWRRMARTGAEFLFLPFKSGLYHVRSSSRSRSPRLTQRQRVAFQSRLDSGTSLYHGSSHGTRTIRKILALTSVFPFVDQSTTVQDFSGAVHLLSRIGFECQGFCPSKWVDGDEEDFERGLSSAGLPFQTQDTTLGAHAARMVYALAGRIPVSAFRTRSVRPSEYVDREGGTFLDYFDRFLLSYRPDALLAFKYGPQPDFVFDLAFHMAKSIDIPTILRLANESALGLPVLQNVDYCVVGSEYLRRRCWDSIGLVCKVLPHAFDVDQARRSSREPKVVTILARNSPGESRIAGKLVDKLNRERPDIPVMVVSEDWKVRRSRMDSPQLPVTRDGSLDDVLSPGRVYSETSILVAPCLGHDLFDRTVAEAMIQAIPVLVSNRGALPETVGNAGIVIDVPECYHPESIQVPNADEISPWVQTIARVWDDPAFLRQVADRCSAHAQCWHPVRTAPVYEEFFRHLQPQPGPPLLPRWSDDWVRHLELPMASQ